MHVFLGRDLAGVLNGLDRLGCERMQSSAEGEQISSVASKIYPFPKGYNIDRAMEHCIKFRGLKESHCDPPFSWGIVIIIINIIK